VSRSPRSRPRPHRLLVVAEALLLLGVARDWVWGRVRASDIPDWGKVLLAMALTLGVLGGLIVFARTLLVRGVAQTHAAAQRAGVGVVLLHFALLVVLFLLYARMLGIDYFARLR
jgi:hypothetical protein